MNSIWWDNSTDSTHIVSRLWANQPGSSGRYLARVRFERGQFVPEPWGRGVGWQPVQPCKTLDEAKAVALALVRMDV